MGTIAARQVDGSMPRGNAESSAIVEKKGVIRFFLSGGSVREAGATPLIPECSAAGYRERGPYGAPARTGWSQ